MPALRPLLCLLLLTTAISLTTGCARPSWVGIGWGGHSGSRGDHDYDHDHSRDYGRRDEGPPPHAPAHGYRHKHHDHGQTVELVYDAGYGIYVVAEIPNRYYWNGVYLRLDGDQWYASKGLDGDWRPRSDGSLPPGCNEVKRQAHHEDEHPGKRKGHAKRENGKKKEHPAKGSW